MRIVGGPLNPMQAAMLKAQVRASMAKRMPDIFKPTADISMPLPRGKRELPIDRSKVRTRTWKS